MRPPPGAIPATGDLPAGVGAQAPASGGGRTALGRAYYALFVLWLVHAIANVDRFSIGLLAESIKTDLRLSDTQVGIFTGAAFVLAYVIAGFPMARWLDRGNRTRILAWAIAVWSAATAACGAAGNFVQIVLARAGVGAGESACVPGAVSLIADHFPRDKRGQAIGIFQSALPAAGIVGTPLVGLLADLYGWRTALFAMGGAGVALALLAGYTLREPGRAGPQSADAAWHAGPPSTFLRDLRAMIGHQAFRSLLLAHGVYSIGILAFVNWYGISLVRTYGMSYTELGLFMGTGLGVVMLLATLASGFLGSKLVRFTGDERWLARLPALFALLSVPALLVACLDVSKTTAMVATSVAFMLTIARTPLTLTLSVNLLPGSMRSTSTFVFVLVTNILGSAIGPLAVGMISDAIAPAQGAAVALRLALLWTVPSLCLLGALLAFLPARHMARRSPGD